MTTRKAMMMAPMVRKPHSGFVVAGSCRSVTTTMHTPMTSRSTTGFVVRDAAVARPSPHSHQAAGCRSLGRSRIVVASAQEGVPACRRERITR